MEQAEANRRLCALVAVDMAGYSGRAETDEDAAVGLVSQLSQLVHEAAGVLGGRVFNTAGDGFMLEFPTVTNALTAAEAIRAGAPAPVRVGLHLGEVAVAPDGDLLGHGVNVAARLQQAADPGEMLVSDEVRRALRGPMAELLEPAGRMRLAKMKEERVVYRLKGTARTKTKFRAPPKAMLMVALALLVCGGLLAWRIAATAPKTDPLLVAVKSFQSNAGPGAGPAYGSAMADRLTSALADRQTPVVSRDLSSQGKTGRARLLIGGTVERDGPTLRVTVRMDDAQSGQALWTSSFERPADEDLALQTQTAVNVADVVVTLRDEIGDARGIRPDVLAAYLKAVDLKRRNRGAFEEQRQAYERLAALAPQSAPVHISLANAISLALRFTDVAPELAARWRAEAMGELKKAGELDPRNARRYTVEADLMPPTDFLGREALLTKAKKLAPEERAVLGYEGEFLRNMGRLKEALVFYQQGLAQDAYRPASLSSNIFSLAGLGRWPESKALGAQAARVLPENSGVRRANLFTALLYGAPAEASTAIDVFQSGSPRLEPVSEKAWRDFVAARAGRLSADAAAKSLLAAPRAENGVDPSTAMSAFALLGRLDEAFAEAERTVARKAELHLSNLDEAATASMRLDPRFWPLMDRLGLLTYWRRSGRWPDFCEAPDRPYDCKARADATAGPLKS